MTELAISGSYNQEGNVSRELAQGRPGVGSSGVAGIRNVLCGMTPTIPLG
jgi:hypothetical protein